VQSVQGGVNPLLRGLGMQAYPVSFLGG
jgi:hypothetical protein